MIDERIAAIPDAVAQTQNPSPAAQPPPMVGHSASNLRRHKWGQSLLLAIPIFALAWLVGSYWSKGISPPTAVSISHQPVLSTAPSVAKELSAETIFAEASPAIVRVEVRDRAFKLIGQGTGFLVSDDGLVATNHHVIQNAYFAHVFFADGSQYPVEGVAASLPSSDVALLKINGRNFPILKLAENELPPVGTKVYAIGNPQGLTNSLSDGLVSGHRQVDDNHSLIQTTAPISPGSSGGPLMSKDGLVVGVTTASIRDGQNLNLVVPVKVLKKVISGRGQLQTLASAGGQPLNSDDAQKLEDVWASIGRQDYGRALKLLAQLQESQKNSAAYWFAVGYVQGQLGNHDLAIDAWRTSIKLNPGDAPTFYNLGHTYQIQHRLQEAIAAYKSALLLKPNDPWALNNSGIAYIELGNFQEAIPFFKSVVAIEPDNAKAWSQMGLACALSNQTNEAVRCLKTAVGLNPNDAPSFRFLGTELKRLRRYEEAIQACSSAVQLDSNDALSYATAGHCYLVLKENHQAKYALGKALRINPNIASAQFDMAMTLINESQKSYVPIEVIKNHFQHAARLDPNGQIGRNAQKCLSVLR